MTINRNQFFSFIKRDLFNNKYTQQQVDGISSILDTWENDYKTLSLPDVAYCLATVYHETAKTMTPIEEYGKGKGKKYGKVDSTTGKAYYGRGYVQLTWLRNYALAGIKLGIDLVKHPELALDLEIASKIMFQGMRDGWFTGKKLSNYCHKNPPDFLNARRIINGLDRAGLIASYARRFLDGLVHSNS